MARNSNNLYLTSAHLAQGLCWPLEICSLSSSRWRLQGNANVSFPEQEREAQRGKAPTAVAELRRDGGEAGMESGAHKAFVFGAQLRGSPSGSPGLHLRPTGSPFVGKDAGI